MSDTTSLRRIADALERIAAVFERESESGGHTKPFEAQLEDAERQHRAAGRTDLADAADRARRELHSLGLRR